MTLKLLKSSFIKQKRRVHNYDNDKFFNNTFFRDQVLNKLGKPKLANKWWGHYNIFKKICLSVLYTIAPLKSRFIQSNQVLFIKNEVWLAAMVRSKQRKKFLKATVNGLYHLTHQPTSSHTQSYPTILSRIKSHPATLADENALNSHTHWLMCSKKVHPPLNML